MSEKTQFQLLPATLLDSDGYPTKAWLKFISNYRPDESLPVLDFVQNVLPDGWHFADWGYKLHRKRKGIRRLELHTGGWSGNEDAIAAILSNPYLRHFEMRHVVWRTGGHYYFEVKA